MAEHCLTICKGDGCCKLFFTWLSGKRLVVVLFRRATIRISVICKKKVKISHQSHGLQQLRWRREGGSFFATWKKSLKKPLERFCLLPFGAPISSISFEVAPLDGATETSVAWDPARWVFSFTIPASPAVWPPPRIIAANREKKT